MSKSSTSAVHGGSSAAAAAAGMTAPLDPVLLVGHQPWWTTDGLDAAMAAADWTHIVAGDVPRARWLASIRHVSLVAIAGDRAFRWRAVEEIRGLTTAPLVVFSDEPNEVVDLVRAGVDAVLSPDEPSHTVLARLAAVFRRADHRRGPGVRYLRSRELVVDLWTQGCTLHGEPLSLSPTEYELLTFLMTRPAVTMPVATIVRRVWDDAPSDGRNALRIAVNRLRRKLGDDPEAPTYIASVRGSGYRFVANVTEVADALTDHAMRVDVTPLLHSVTTLAEQLAPTKGDGDASEVLADVLDSAGLADGLAVFRNDHARMRLVAVRHMPDAWLESVADGVPLDPSFASAVSVMTGEVVQFADVRVVSGQFGATARHLAGEGFRACHFVPIARGGVTWGHLGLARRSPSPLDAITMAYLRTLCATFLLHLEDRGCCRADDPGR